jgi:hypothetical protein
MNVYFKDYLARQPCFSSKLLLDSLSIYVFTITSQRAIDWHVCEIYFRGYMLSHTHPARFYIEACWACGGKRISHTETAKENHCNRKTQRNPIAVLWHPTNRHTHIKRQNRFALVRGEKDAAKQQPSALTNELRKNSE